MDLNFYAGGGWLDVNEIWFVLPIIISLSAFFYAFQALRLPWWDIIVLDVSMTLAVMVATPNLFYPIGSTYYEEISATFGKLSIAFMLFNAVCYVLSLALQNHERDQDKGDYQ